MIVDWKAFLEIIKNNPKEFAYGIIKYLNPPEYAKEELVKYTETCYLCWNKRVDECCICWEPICEEHSIEIKKDLIWFVCYTCKDNLNEMQILETIELLI